MSPHGRPKGSCRSAQHEGIPVSPHGRPKGSYRSAQHEGTPVSALHGHILTPHGFVDGTIEFDANGRVARVDGTPIGDEAVRDAAAPKLLPGFIDLHVHGGGGREQ